MASRPQPRYQPGDKIGGRYQVHQVLMGGMGEVYLCLDLEETLPYALKTFQHRYQTGTQRLRQAFEKEVAAWVALEKHPNIVRCFYMTTLDNQPFMVLEWIAGEEGRGADMRGWLRRGPLDLRTALDFSIDICRGLIHAQEKQPGLVHRDLKPKNILIAQGGLAKITDFGLVEIVECAELELDTAQVETDGRQSVVGHKGIAGTPAYMAPEQWMGESLDERTDIYALGCILYEMLTGRFPFEASTDSGFRHQHLKAAVPKLADNQRWPSSLDTLLTRCLAKARAERPANLVVLLAQIDALYRGQFSAAPRTIPAVEEFTVVDYNNRGHTYHKLQQYEAALRDCGRAIELDPNFALAYSNRGLTYHDLQQHEAALCDYGRAIELDPNLAGAYSNRGNTYAELQQYEAALRDYGRAIELDPNFAQAYSNRGLTYHNLQRYEAALHDYGRAIELDPNDAQAYSNRGNTYGDLQQYEAALRDYGRAIELDPNFAQAYSNRGATYRNLQQYEAALRDYGRAIDLDPNFAKAYYNRGITYYKLQQHEAALRDFGWAIELDPNYAPAYVNRGNTYDKLQQYEAALRDYERAIKLDPNDATVYINLGALFANTGQLRESLPYFEKAAQLGYPSALQTVAQVRQMLGMETAPPVDSTQQAFEAFQRAGSAEAMRQVVARFPFMTQADFIAAIEQAIAQVPPHQRSAFEQRLTWLRAIAKEQNQ